MRSAAAAISGARVSSAPIQNEGVLNSSINLSVAQTLIESPITVVAELSVSSKTAVLAQPSDLSNREITLGKSRIERPYREARVGCVSTSGMHRGISPSDIGR